MKLNSIKYIVVLAVSLLSACEIEDQVNPNNAVLEDILANASKTDLNNLVAGSIYNLRASHDVYVTSTGTVARELYLFDADPRNLTDLLGFDSEGKPTDLDGNTYYTTAPWNDRYQTIKNLNILEQALINAQPDVTEAEKDGYRALLNTLKAHQYLMLINAQYQNGIRLDVSDPDNLGPIVKDVSLVYDFILDLLDEGLSNLNSAEFAFSLPSGFDGFDTPSSFAEFNRALYARVSLYDDANQNALDALSESFFSLSSDISVGPKMDYSLIGSDLSNNLFKTPQQNGDQIIVNDGVIADAEDGDLRIQEKIVLREVPNSQGGTNGAYETSLYEGANSSIDIIRNEELILIYAEANIRLNNLSSGIEALNVIRQSAGLPTLDIAKPDIVNDQAALLEEVLRQRRYSFWGEGHFMVDLRRFGELNENSEFVDVDVIIKGEEEMPQEIFMMFPVPTTEN